MNGPLTSPWILQMGDETGSVEFRVAFNESTQALQNVTVIRSEGYQYGTVLLNNSVRYPIPVGTTTVSKGQLNSAGLSVLGDIVSYTLER